MNRAEVEALGRATDVFDHRYASPSDSASDSGHGGAAVAPASGAPAAAAPAAGATVTAAAIARGYYPPLPLAPGLRADPGRDADAAAEPERAAGATEPAPAAGTLPPELETLLWGWDILDVLAAHGIEEVETRDFDGGPREALILMLSLEGRAGQYSLEERRRIVELFDRTEVEIDEEVNVLVSAGKPFAPAIRRYAALPQPLRTMVDQEILDVKTAERWSEYPKAASVAATAATGRARTQAGGRPRLSFSERRRLFTMLYEIARRDRLSDAELRSLVEEIAAAAEPLSAVRERRYPKLSQLERGFSEVAERSLGGSGVRLSPPPYFEGSRFTVEFSFGSTGELAKRVAALHRLQDNADELFELL